MHILRQLATVILPVALFIPGITNAAVVMPALDIALLDGDSGAVLTGDPASGFVFDIDATAFKIVTNDIDNPIEIPDQSFTLHGTYDGAFFFGTFDVAGGLLSGTFDKLKITVLSNGSVDFKTDLIYTSGSLKGGLNGGRLEGIQQVLEDGTQGELFAKLGPVVVPVPAAVWLFGSGLIGLIGVARRKA